MKTKSDRSEFWSELKKCMAVVLLTHRTTAWSMDFGVHRPSLFKMRFESGSGGEMSMTRKRAAPIVYPL